MELTKTKLNKIREKSKNDNTSLNKTIQSLLKKALGLSTKLDNNHEDEFADFLGVWSKKDKNDFNKNINDLNRIDESDWK